MENLSTDVWRYIFELACVDGGKTGISLSRASKSIRNVSAPVRFHSVELTRASQVQKFLARLDDVRAAAAASERDPPRVRHLLLAFLPGKTDVCFLGPSFHFRDLHSWQGDKTGWNGRLVSALTQLLARIAPDLRTLAVLGHREVLLPYVPCTLPALREFTLLQQDRVFVRAPPEGDAWMEPSDKEFYSAGAPPDRAALAAAPIFPALERLHLVDGKWDGTLPLWAAAAPRLAHLRISGAEGASCQALKELVAASPQNFGALRTVVISPAARQDGTPLDIVEVDVVSEFRLSLPTLDVSVVSGPKTNSRDRDGYWQTHLKEEWRKRAGGWWGTSVWMEDEEA